MNGSLRAIKRGFYDLDITFTWFESMETLYYVCMVLQEQVLAGRVVGQFPAPAASDDASDS
jgi:hypothetical protein